MSPQPSRRWCRKIPTLLGHMDPQVILPTSMPWVLTLSVTTIAFPFIFLQSSAYCLRIPFHSSQPAILTRAYGIKSNLC